MKKRVLLLGPCGGCGSAAERNAKKAAMLVLSTIIKGANGKYPVNGPAKDDFVKKAIDVMKNLPADKGGNDLGPGQSYEDAVNQYNKMNAECGFGFKSAS